MCPLETRLVCVSVNMCSCVLGGNVNTQRYAFGACKCVAFLCCRYHLYTMYPSFVATWFVRDLKLVRPLSEPTCLCERLLPFSLNGRQLSQMRVFHPKGKEVTGQLAISVQRPLLPWWHGGTWWTDRWWEHWVLSKSVTMKERVAVLLVLWCDYHRYGGGSGCRPSHAGVTWAQIELSVEAKFYNALAG